MAKKDVLVVFSYHVYPGEGELFKEHVTFLNEVQGADPDLRFHYGALCNMEFVYDGKELKIMVPELGKAVTDFDFVFFQKWMRLPQLALAVAVNLEAANVPFMPHQIIDQIAMHKTAELAMFARSDLPTPKTVVAPMDAIRRMASDGSLPFSYPFILKGVNASMGTNNFLIKSYDDLADKHDTSNASTFMAQEFIANDCDYRFVVADNEILYVLRRTSEEGSHLNNTSQGGKGDFIDVSEFSDEVIRTAKDAAKSVGRSDFAGVDIIIAADGKPWVLEVNRSPAIQTGHDAAHKSKLLIGHIAKRLGL